MYKGGHLGGQRGNPDTIKVLISCQNPLSRDGAGRKLMRCLIYVVLVAVLLVPAIGAAPQQQTAPAGPGWAFPVRDPNPPAAAEEPGPLKAPGSAKTYTRAQIDDTFNPPDSVSRMSMPHCLKWWPMASAKGARMRFDAISHIWNGPPGIRYCRRFHHCLLPAADGGL